MRGGESERKQEGRPQTQREPDCRGKREWRLWRRSRGGVGLWAGRGALRKMWRRGAVEATSKRVEASKRLEKVRNGGAGGGGSLYMRHWV